MLQDHLRQSPPDRFSSNATLCAGFLRLLIFSMQFVNLIAIILECSHFDVND